MSVFQEPSFWQPFEQQVRSEHWKCDFSTRDLLDTLDVDAALYVDPSVLRHRRTTVVPWVGHETQWTTLVLGATDELSRGLPGPHATVLRGMRMLDALEDLVEHLHWFHTVSAHMGGAGQIVMPISGVHDIDKLDPVMLVGYSERFEDGVTTTLWEKCVGRHVSTNPHHQGNALWAEKESQNHAFLTKWGGTDIPSHALLQEDGADPAWSELGRLELPSHALWVEHGGGADLKEQALLEMVCDKVSRHLQKDLRGAVGGAMWEVEGVYFQGLPPIWMDRASRMMKLLKAATFPTVA